MIAPIDAIPIKALCFAVVYMWSVLFGTTLQTGQPKYALLNNTQNNYLENFSGESATGPPNGNQKELSPYYLQNNEVESDDVILYDSLRFLEEGAPLVFNEAMNNRMLI